MRKLLLYIALLFFGLQSTAQEQADLTTYMYSRQFINPATIAANEVLQGALVYRTQWVGLDGAPESQLFNVNTTPFRRVPIHKVGLTVFNDRIGVNNTTDIAVDYAFKAKLAYKRYFSLSISPMLVLQQSDFGSIATDFENDPLFIGNSQTFSAFNVRLGFYYQQDDFFLGASIPKLLTNQIIQETGAYEMTSSFDPAQLALIGHGGYNLRLNKYFTFTPSFLVKYETGQPARIDLNGIFDYQERFGGGVSYRTLRNASAIVYAQLTDQFRFAYSFNYNFGRIRTVSSGTHEVQLIFGLFNTSVTPVNMHRMLLDQKKKKSREYEQEQKKKEKKAKRKKNSNTINFLEESEDEEQKAKKKKKKKDEKKEKIESETEERQPYKQ